MSSADVVVVGAGLAGMATALGLADRGARVVVVARGHAAGYWVGGPIDVAAPPGARTAADGVAALAAVGGHPYALLGDDAAPAVDWFLAATRAAGAVHAGRLDADLAALPTGLGATRPVAIVPDGQSAALAAWGPDERLVIVGPAGFKDLWPHAVAASLSGDEIWAGASRPADVVGLSVELPGVAGRRNLNGLVLAELFDDAAWRGRALDVIARAVDRVRGPFRVALPAVLGRADHVRALDEARRRVGRPLLELPLVPPSLPGLRLQAALRRAFRSRGGRILLGEAVSRVETDGRRATAVATPAAAREHVVRTEAVVLATGGIPGGGIVGDVGGSLCEDVLGLPVEGPPVDAWLQGDPLDPSTLPVAPAGLRTDAELRPIDPGRPDDGPLYDNVRVVGGLLAGQRYLRERCGDGVALASAVRAARSLAAVPAGTAATDRPVAARPVAGAGGGSDR